MKILELWKKVRKKKEEDSEKWYMHNIRIIVLVSQRVNDVENN